MANVLADCLAPTKNEPIFPLTASPEWVFVQDVSLPPCPIHRIIPSSISKSVASGVSVIVMWRLAKQIAPVIELNLGDAAQVPLLQPVEDDDIIHPVQEFGPEMIPFF